MARPRRGGPGPGTGLRRSDRRGLAGRFGFPALGPDTGDSVLIVIYDKEGNCAFCVALLLALPRVNTSNIANRSNIFL